MSRGVFQPVGQKRLTNIAVVRLKKGGTRFEIACYRNKVGDWRVGIEKDLDEVLQTTEVFSNVGKGIVAKDKDLQAAFGTTDRDTICKEILTKGELQVSDKERKSDYDNLFKDVATLLSEKCVNPDTNRPYTITMLERAMRDIHFNVDLKKNAKQLMLEAIPQLKTKFSIERALMQLKVQVPVEVREELYDNLAQRGAKILTAEVVGGNFLVMVQVDPGLFRDLHMLLQSLAGGRSRLEVSNLAVMNDGATGDDFTVPTTTTAGPSSTAAYTQPPASTPYTQPSEPSTSASTPAATSTSHTAYTRQGSRGEGSGGAVVYPRGPISGIPDEHESRRQRFAELDTLQAGWEVELISRGSIVDAVFYAPLGERVGPYANARRAALQAHKQQVPAPVGGSYVLL